MEILIIISKLSNHLNTMKLVISVVQVIRLLHTDQQIITSTNQALLMLFLMKFPKIMKQKIKPTINLFHNPKFNSISNLNHNNCNLLLFRNNLKYKSHQHNRINLLKIHIVNKNNLNRNNLREIHLRLDSHKNSRIVRYRIRNLSSIKKVVTMRVLK